MSLQGKLREAELADDTVLTLSYSTGGDVIHAHDGYMEDILNNTDFAQTVAEVITTSGFNNNVIDDMRAQDFLEANVRAKVEDIMSAPESLFIGWSTDVDTNVGTLRIDG